MVWHLQRSSYLCTKMHGNMHRTADPMILNHDIRHLSILALLHPRERCLRALKRAFHRKLAPLLAPRWVFQGKIGPFSGSFRHLKRGAHPTSQYSTRHTPIHNGGADNNNYQIFSHQADDENKYSKKVKTSFDKILCHIIL